MITFTLPESTLRKMGQRVFDIGFEQTDVITERLVQREVATDRDAEFVTLAEAAQGLLKRRQEAAYRAYGCEYRKQAFASLRRVLTPRPILVRRVTQAGAHFDALMAECAGLDDADIETFIAQHDLDITIDRLPADKEITFAGELLPVGSKMAFLSTSTYGPPNLTIAVVASHRAVFPFSGGHPTIEHQCVDRGARSLNGVCSKTVAEARAKGMVRTTWNHDIYLDVDAGKAAAIETCRSQIRGMEALIAAFEGDDVPTSQQMQRIVTAAQMPTIEDQMS